MDEMLRGIRGEINVDRALGASVLFPHRHRQESPSFHVKIMDLWRSLDENIVIEAFRQGAKTTLSEEFLLMEALFVNYKYCLIFGETYTKACQRIESMKHELVTNSKIIKMFGAQKGQVWSENKITLKNGVAIEAHGWEEEIRGYLHLSARPDRAYLDDIETEERVRDTATVDKNWRKLHKQLMPAMDKEFAKIRMTGTPLADDCMIRRAAQSSNWTAGHFPIADTELTTSMWPERYPIEWIKAKQEQMSKEGMLREFNQEYMLIPTGAQGKPFDETMLRFEDISPMAYSPRVTIIDPARTVNVGKSDQTGHVTVSRIGTRIYVHESGAEYWQPDQIVNAAFDISNRNDDSEVVIEKNSLDDWLLQPIRLRMLTSGRTLKLNPVNAPQDRDKAQFIMGLRPFLMSGDIIFVGGRAKHQALISQILNFPSGKRDTLNALAYAPRVFSGISVYQDFTESNITSGYEPPRQSSFVLGINSNGGDTAAVLISIDGSHSTVVADWISPLVPADAVPDIARLIRAVYPGRKVTAWVPADVFDQTGRDPLVTALKSSGLPAQRSEYSVMGRGSLSPELRTDLRGRRLLRVDTQARNTLSAFSSGYRYPIKSNGERSSEPERGSARVLMEALETLHCAINKIDTAKTVKSNAFNSIGTPYLSALPK